MALANYVIRRGAFYAWRRVWRGKAVQIPLSTTDPARARRLASVATAASSVGYGLLDAGRISIHDVKKGVHAAVQREMLALDYEAAGGDPENARPGGHDFFFFFISGDEPDEEPEPPKKRQPRSASPKAPVAPSPNPDSVPLTPLGHSGPVEAVERPQRAAQTPQTPSGASPLIMDAVQRLSRVHKRTGRASDKSIEQFTGIAALFVEITGVDDVRAVRQHHIAAFVDAMDRLPPTYRRSAAERDKPIAAIIAEAEATGAETGLSAATVNRNLIQLGKVFKAAQSEGIRVDPSLNPSLLRRFEKKTPRTTATHSRLMM